jgi:preprotein translocase subunit YajC
VKEILDIIVLVLFVFMVFMFIKGFNKQQIEKHKDKLNDIETNNKRSRDKENVDE